MSLSPFQFQMFMPAKDLVDPEKTFSWERSAHGGDKALWRTKLGAAQWDEDGMKESLYTNIRREGIHEPVEMAPPEDFVGGKPTLLNGHHRVASAYDINPHTEVPVRWDPVEG